MTTTWDRDEDKIAEYVGRMDRLGPRKVGEAELLEAVPARIQTLLVGSRR